MVGKAQGKFGEGTFGDGVTWAVGDKVATDASGNEVPIPGTTEPEAPKVEEKEEEKEETASDDVETSGDNS